MRRVSPLSTLFNLDMLPWITIAALSMIMTAAFASCAEVNIDYSHNLIGTGTVMTDFKMGSEEDTLATGRVRGSGEVKNLYTFLSNSTKNVSIEDQFIFQELPVTAKITLPDYPQMAGMPKSLRLLGTSWAAKINLTGQQNHSFAPRQRFI